ncbi:o-succinylbenzoate--CoA ligase [Solicola gregarius]|uniref:O-succinylbenzoate--CoA ligase n=1 Tax=Solicola gregarius TaxID=2908642 RepID=A0AA46YIW4_9ACTN|nr:o-succinylbenzoate--CoA ligase [Solicola gregarius]UYM03660.1 o-succinylbenzoate--CoA ligase [Solicola gregarius]
MSEPSLRPVTGAPHEVIPLLRDWLAAPGSVEPLVVATSGSTGQPKGVRLSREAVSASAAATHARLGGPGQWLLDLPATYVAGVQVLVRSLIAGYEPVVAGDHGSFGAAVDALSADRRYVSLVPTQLHRLVQSGDVEILRSFDAVLLGGAASSPALVDAARAAGVRVVRTYGMSETSGGCVYDGMPLDGVRVRIGDDRRVQLAGPMLFDGYAGDADATAEVLQDGWFATSDLGELDSDGRLRIIGRVDDVVVSGGVNVPLPAVTEALRAYDGVRDAMAIGVDDAEWGTRVVACVVSGAGADLASLRDALVAAGLPRTWAPRQLVPLDALPLLPNGKVDRVALRELAAG